MSSIACTKLTTVLKEIAELNANRMCTIKQLEQLTGIERRQLVALLLNFHRSGLVRRLYTPTGKALYAWDTKMYPVNQHRIL